VTYCSSAGLTYSQDWIMELQERVISVREKLRESAKKSQSVRKTEFDKKAVRRNFQVGEIMLTRLPGMQNKLEHAWVCGQGSCLDVKHEQLVMHSGMCWSIKDP